MRFSLAAAVSAATLTLALGSGAFAQMAPPSPPTAVRGTIVSFDGSVLTVQGATSTYKVTLAPNVRVQWVVKSDFSKITPGDFIGTAAVPMPDGTYKALEIQFFNQQNHPAETNRPWDVAPQSTMTNATIDSINDATITGISGHVLDLKWSGGEKKIFVPADAPVVSFTPADTSALTPGASVLTFATRKDDGTLTAAAVNVGKDGLKIPY